MNDDSVFSIKGLDVRYNGAPALKAVDMELGPRQITAFIGPSGCG